jgi:hypothetical protein
MGIQNVSQNDSMMCVLDLVLDPWHFASLEASDFVPIMLLRNPETYIYANNQTNEHRVQTGDHGRDPLPERRPLSSNGLPVVMAS